MKKISYNIDINAAAKKVWQVLWFTDTYKKWTSVFCKDGHCHGNWEEGTTMQFLNAAGNGIYAVIEKNIAHVQMTIKHQGEIKDGIQKTSSSWASALEQYHLTEQNGITTLQISMDTTQEMEAYFVETFPKALALIKQIAEQAIPITVEALVLVPIEKAWQYFTTPTHITQWNFAADSWQCPAATNNLTVGGNFVYRMEAKDGSFGFNFSGIYTSVQLHEHITIFLDDGRTVFVRFLNHATGCKLVQVFDAEDENDLALQQGGWQAILNNFKKYTETN
jgi:uncharacterized protein YndB with AHSA1/START domain